MKKSNDFFHLLEDEMMRKSNFPCFNSEKSIPELFCSNFSLFFISSSMSFLCALYLSYYLRLVYLVKSNEFPRLLLLLRGLSLPFSFFSAIVGMPKNKKSLEFAFFEFLLPTSLSDYSSSFSPSLNQVNLLDN